MPISVSLDNSILFRWNNRFRIILCNEIKNIIRIIPAVSQHTGKVESFKQRNGLGCIPPFARRSIAIARDSQAHPLWHEFLC